MKLALSILTILFTSALYSQSIPSGFHQKAKLQSLIVSFKSLYSQYQSKGDKSISTYNQSKLDDLQKQIEETSTDSYEYYYVKYLNSSKENRNYSSLITAYSINKSNSDLWFDMISYANVMDNKELKNELNNKLKTINLSSNYAYNLLQSVSIDGVLLTYGKADTYNALILQAKGIRKDVLILNYDWLLDKNFRLYLSKNKGLKTDFSYSNRIKNIKNFILKNKNKKIFISTAYSPTLIAQLKKNLYLTGLSFKYSQSGYSNVGVLMSNYAKMKWTFNTYQSIDVNYLPFLIQLSQHYKKINRNDLYTKTKNQSLSIAKALNKSDEIKKYFTD